MNYIQLALLAVAVTGAVIEAYFDGKKIKAKKRVGKGWSAAGRIAVSFGLSHLFFVGFFYPLLVAISNLIAFWIVFDPVVNVFSGKSIRHMGSTSRIDGAVLWLRDKIANTKFLRGFSVDMETYTMFKALLLISILTILSFM